MTPEGELTGAQIAAAGLGLASLCGLPLVLRWFWPPARRQRLHRQLLVLAPAVLLGGGSFFLGERLEEWVSALNLDTPNAAKTALRVLLGAAIEEALAVLAAWPLREHLAPIGASRGAAVGATAGAGLSAGRAFGMLLVSTSTGLDAARAWASGIGHLLSASAWGAVLGSARPARGFGPVWLAAVLLRALLDYIALTRGPGLLLLAVPVALTLALFAYLVARRLHSREVQQGSAGSAPWSEPAAVEEVLAELQPQPGRLRALTIAWSTLVCAGAALTAATAGVAASRALGLDFGAAAESQLSSNAPLLLVALALAAAMPMAGFLIRRSAPTSSAIEAALGAAAAAFGATVLTLSEPVATLVALAAIPLAFGLTLAGAWLGGRAHRN